MRLIKPLSILTSLALLASCGGGGSSSDPEQPIIQSSTPTNFFSIDSVERTRFDSGVPISFDEFFDTALLDIIVNGGDETTFYDYENDNLSNELTIDNLGVIRAEVFYNYTFNNNQVTNRERIRQFFNEDGSLSSERVTNTEWSGDIPVSFSTVSTSFSSIDGTTTINERDFIYETNSLGQVIRTVELFEVADGENIVSSESEFSSINNEFLSIGDESINTLFNTTTNETIRQSFYTYDDENNTIITISQFFADNEVTNSTISFNIHFSDLNQTIRFTLDLEQFNNDRISGATILTYNYFEIDSCGDYTEMQTAAFNTFIPTCITNLTYNN